MRPLDAYMCVRLFFKVPSARIIYGSASRVTCLVYSLFSVLL